MEESEESNISKKPRFFKTDVIVAFAAVLISVMTLFVYIYQTRLMREQQHISVWPYLEWYMTKRTDEGFYLSVVNKGVGPAIIKSTSLSLDGKAITTREYLSKLVGKLDTLSIFYNEVNKRVIAPGEEIRLFQIYNPEISKSLPPNVFARTQYEICYCSIYGDCWTSKGLTVVEDECD